MKVEIDEETLLTLVNAANALSALLSDTVGHADEPLEDYFSDVAELHVDAHPVVPAELHDDLFDYVDAEGRCLPVSSIPSQKAISRRFRQWCQRNGMVVRYAKRHLNGDPRQTTVMYLDSLEAYRRAMK